MISVIIPSKNEAVTLWFTLHSIKMEMDRDPGAEPCEIIVVDNGSTDSTQKFLEDHSIHPWVKRVTTDLSGPGPVRNAGAEVAQGEILLFLDAHVMVSPGFFRNLSNTIRGKIWKNVGSLHFPIGWNGFKTDEFTSRYDLTLDQNFWGNSVPGYFTTLTEIAAAGHACIAVRRDHFFKVGAYHPAHAGYGGDECYLDLKFAMFGYRNYSDPGGYCLHCSQRHMNYVWTNFDVERNNMISAYALGDTPWVEEVYCWKLAKGYPEDELKQAREAALQAAKADRKWVKANAKYTLEEVLASFKRRKVPH